MSKASSLFKRPARAAEEAPVPTPAEPILEAIYPEPLLRLEGLHASTGLTVRYNSVVAWEQDLSENKADAAAGLGVRVHLSNGDSVHLPRLAFATVTSAFQAHHGSAFATDFISGPQGLYFYIRVSAVLGWSNVGTTRMHVAGGHVLGLRSIDHSPAFGHVPVTLVKKGEIASRLNSQATQDVAAKPHFVSLWALKARLGDSPKEPSRDHSLTAVTTET